MTDKDSLWPEFNLKKEITPKEILEKQGDYLREFTDQYLKLDVIRHKNSAPLYEPILENEFSYSCYLRSVTLRDYKYKLMDFGHNITFYPLEIKLSAELNKDMSHCQTKYPYNKGERMWKVSSKDQFEEFLAELFKGKSFIQIISSLYSLSS